VVRERDRDLAQDQRWVAIINLNVGSSRTSFPRARLGAVVAQDTGLRFAYQVASEIAGLQEGLERDGLILLVAKD
jgi:hypothetical protein